MKNKFHLLLMLLTIIVISFPSVCLSEMKTVTGEYCDVYLGDMKNKKELDQFRQTVKRMSIKDGINKLIDRPWNYYAKDECYQFVIDNHLEKVVVDSHTERSRKICYKIKITTDTEVVNKYLSQEICISKSTFVPFWFSHIDDVLTKKSDKINIGLIIEIKIPDIEGQKREQLENEQEEVFFSMMSNNKDKYKYVDRRHLNKVLEEQKLSSSGLTDSDTVKLGKILNLDIIVLRLIYKDNQVTKVLKVDTGEVLLFKSNRLTNPSFQPRNF